MRRNNRKLSDIARGALAACRRAARRLVPSGRAFAFARPVLQSGFRSRTGFTLIEIAFAVEVMMLLTLIGFNETRRIREHARVAACLQYQASVQRALWGDYALTGDFPANLAAALDQMPNCSIGNDFSYKGGMADGFFGEYYLRCDHDHSYVGILFVDSGAYLSSKPIYNLATARGNV
jgi:hypothetical protein